MKITNEVKAADAVFMDFGKSFGEVPSDRSKIKSPEIFGDLLN